MHIQVRSIQGGALALMVVGLQQLVIYIYYISTIDRADQQSYRFGAPPCSENPFKSKGIST